MIIHIIPEIDNVVILESNEDATFIGQLVYSKHRTDIDYIIQNLSATEEILPHNVYRLGRTNQIKIYRLLLKLPTN